MRQSSSISGGTGQENFFMRRVALASVIALVCISAYLLLGMQGGNPAAPNQTAGQNASSGGAPPGNASQGGLPVFQQPPAEEPSSPGNETVNETGNETVNDTAGGETGNETAENMTEGGNTTDSTSLNATNPANQTLIRPPRGDYLSRIEVSIGNIGYPQSLYIVQDTWAAMDGVVTSSLDPNKRRATTIFADWMVSEGELVQAIKVRFTASVIKRDNCTYDLNFENYCCDGKCVYRKGLRTELS